LMNCFVKLCVLVALLTPFCVAENDTQFTAFCDIVKLVKEDAVCEPTCEDGSYSLEGVVASCDNAKKNFVQLKASGLGLKSIPQSLNAMTKLQFLNLANNELTALPVLDALTALKTVYIFSNKLTTITGVFPNSKNLEFVSANNNELVELPPEYAQTKLITLNFGNNSVAKLPDEYVNLTLSSIDMSRNMLDCSEIKSKFPKTSLFATECVQAQQKTEDGYPALPTSFPTEPPEEGLDGYEITSIILFCIFVVGAVLAIVFYIRYRNGGISA